MARSKQVTKKATKPAEAPLTTKAASGTPYQLDPAQVERAANALVAHMKKHASAKQEVAATKDLLADDDDDVQENDQPIFLSVSTKKHVNNTNRLKPTKMLVCDEKKYAPRQDANPSPAPCPTPLSPTTQRSASSQRIPSAPTRTLLPRTPSPPPSVSESAA
jgi:hypothetical protein